MVLTILDADPHRLEVNFVAPMARPLPFIATSQGHRSKRTRPSSERGGRHHQMPRNLTPDGARDYLAHPSPPSG
jgi:hypothetical protein